MMLAREPTAAPNAKPELVAAIRDIVAWVKALRRGPQGTMPIPRASLPDPDQYNGCTVSLTDGASGRPTATAIGGVWKYQDGVAV